MCSTVEKKYFDKINLCQVKKIEELVLFCLHKTKVKKLFLLLEQTLQ